LHQLKHDTHFAQESLANALDSYLITNNNNLKELNSRIKEIISDRENDKLHTKVSDLESKLSIIQSKIINFATVEEAREALKDIKSDLVCSISDLKEDISRLDKFKAGIDATNDALAQKADAILVEQVLDQKATKEELGLLKKEFGSRIEQVSTLKLDTDKFELHTSAIKSTLENVGKDITQKSNIKDVCKLLDLKANNSSVEKSISWCKQEISARLPLQQYEEDKSKQGFILDVLTQENFVGRWVWKSGDIKQNQSVPWEFQTSNTAPDN